jgi:DNA processing protein
MSGPFALVVEMEEKAYWLGFNIVPRIGPVRVRALLDRFGTLREAWHAPVSALEDAGLNKRAVDNLVTMRKELALDQEWERIEKHGIQILTWEDEAYPRLLREIYSAPPVLYVLGTLEPADEWAVAVVGTRRATSYGRQVAQQLAGDLARNQITVVSGLARGIDSAAHKAALDAGGRTIAVFGCGLDTVYPPENRNLAKRIMKQGALVSEYPLGTKPEARNFPPRNRIISGLTLGTVVVEGGVKSGALITARDALEQNREVFAVPGNINYRQSRGTNRLIRDSEAKLVASVEDILVELNLTAAKQQAEVRRVVPANKTEALLLKHLSTEPVHIDEICREVAMTVAEVSSTLTLMELKGLVRQVGAMNYVVAREAGVDYLAT